MTLSWCCLFFFFNDTATTEIYTLSLHDALPISRRAEDEVRPAGALVRQGEALLPVDPLDRKSTRLNSSHSQISYAVFCLKKKKKSTTPQTTYTLAMMTASSPPESTLTTIYIEHF